MLLGFVLELGHPGKLTKLGVTVEHPGQLCMLCYLALNKENAPFQVNADGQHQGIGFQDIFAESRGLLTHSDGVQVGQSVDALIIVLQAYKVLQRSQIVAQSKGACGLNHT